MRNSLLPLWILFVAVSCVDQKDYKLNSVGVSPSMAVPVAFGVLTIQDILKSTDSLYVKVYPDDLIYLEYTRQLISKDIRNLFSIPDKAINQSFVLPPGTIPAHNKDIRSDSVVEVIDLGLSPAQLSSIDFKSGTISYSSTLLPSSNLQYEVLLSSTDLISKTSNQAFSVAVNGTGSLSLSDYKVTLNKNKFNLKMVLVLKQTGSSTNINPNTSVAVNFSMGGMEFNVILGFFGDQTVSPPSDLLSIGAFGKTLNGANVSFAQPMVSLIVSNDYGVPINVDFTKIEGRKTGATLPLQLNPASPISVAYPATLGTSATTSVAVTNAKQVLDFAPTEIFYQITARTNQGLVSGNDFMADTSKLKVKLNVEVPIYGHASGIILRDTAKIDLSKLNQSQVQKASLKVDVTNELPLDARIQLYLADEHYVVLDSLLGTSQTSLIVGSKVDANGELATIGMMNSLLPLDNDKLGKIFTAKNLIIVAVLNTSKDTNGNAVDVKFKSKYTLKINMGLLADLNFNIKF